MGIDQAIWAYLDRGDSAGTAVAYSAHVGGFAFGVGASLIMVMLFGRGDQDDDLDDARRERAPVADPGDALRFDACMQAIRRKDLAAVRTNASRAILDLSRSNSHVRVLELYGAMASKLEHVPITDGAYAASARAADALGDSSLYIAIANGFMTEHPGSAQLPKVMWSLARHHRDAGNVELERATLVELVHRFPNDALAAKAKQELARA